MNIIIQEDYQSISHYVAQYTTQKIQSKITEKSEIQTQTMFVLGLPTGSSIIGTYQKLIQLYQQAKLSFKNVITFNMDEYVGLSPEDPQSYSYFMYSHLFNHIDIDSNNIHLFDGLSKDIDTQIQNYEIAIKQSGGIDLFLGGIGQNGHLAFNEPYSSLSSYSHCQILTENTRQANACFFDNMIEKVPKTAYTVGIQTIMDAHEVLIIASGKNKAHALHHVIEGNISHSCPTSILQLHPHATIVCDKEACSSLSSEAYQYFLSLQPTTI